MSDELFEQAKRIAEDAILEMTPDEMLETTFNAVEELIRLMTAVAEKNDKEVDHLYNHYLCLLMAINGAAKRDKLCELTAIIVTYVDSQIDSDPGSYIYLN